MAGVLSYQSLPRRRAPRRGGRGDERQRMSIQRHAKVADGGVQQEAPGDTLPRNARQFLRPHLHALKPYTPILPFEVLSEKQGRKPEEIVKLDANENPYGPPPEVLAAMGEMRFPHIYPDPECRRLRGLLAEESGVAAELLLVGCGADELIDLLMRCTLEPGEKIIDCPPTFTMYAFDAAVNAAEVVTVPRNADFTIDLPGVKEAIAEHDPKIIFMTSPNNPDGSILSDADLREVLELPVLVVLDEAYVEFTDAPSRIKWVEDHDNLVVLRTFSKRAGLAGMRVGYGAFPPGIVEYLWRAKQPYNVSAAAEVAACAALSNGGYLEAVRSALIDERNRLMRELSSIPYLVPFPSHANFILCEVLEPWSGSELRDCLADSGIMVRHYTKPSLNYHSMRHDFHSSLVCADTALHASLSSQDDKFVLDVVQGRHVTIAGGEQRAKDATGRTRGKRDEHSSLLGFLRNAFLPEGFPSSVSEDYLHFQAWDSVQATCSYVRGTMSTSALLRGLGVGSASANIASATVLWVARDLCGMAARIVFALTKGGAIDAECKRWRLFADCMNNVGLLLDLFSPLFPSFFVILACLSSVARSLCGVAAGAARASMTAHFAILANTGDCASKEETQETATSLIGMLLGMVVSQIVGESTTSTWFLFSGLTLLHVYANDRAVRSLALVSINRSRARILWDEWRKRKEGSDKQKGSAVLSPKEVATMDPIWPRVSLSSADTVRLGECFSVTKSDVDSVKVDDSFIAMKCNGDVPVCVLLNASGRSSKCELLRAYLYGQSLHDATIEQVDEDFRRHWDSFIRAIEVSKWDYPDRVIMSPGPCTVEWEKMEKRD